MPHSTTRAQHHMPLTRTAHANVVAGLQPQQPQHVAYVAWRKTEGLGAILEYGAAVLAAPLERTVVAAQLAAGVLVYHLLQPRSQADVRDGVERARGIEQSHGFPRLGTVGPRRLHHQARVVAHAVIVTHTVVLIVFIPVLLAAVALPPSRLSVRRPRAGLARTRLASPSTTASSPLRLARGGRWARTCTARHRCKPRQRRRSRLLLIRLPW